MGAHAVTPEIEQPTRSAVSALDANQTNTSVTIERFEVANSTVTLHNGTEAVWQSKPIHFTAWLSSTGNRSVYNVCGYEATSETNVTTLNCQNVGVTPSGNTVSLVYDAPNASTGRHRFWVNATHITSDANRASDSRSLELFVLNATADEDQDKLTNEREVELGTNISASDTDGDDLIDGDEVKIYNTDPTSRDTDGDSLPDGVEVNGVSNATLEDTDGDGLPDGVEHRKGLEPDDPHSDGDNLTDAEELSYGTDPLQADTDNDGLRDGRELELGTEPNVSDTDNDGVSDGREVELGLDPNDPDTDGDFVRDGVELMLGLNPTSALQTILTALLGLALLIGLVVALSRSTIVSLPTDQVPALGPAQTETPQGQTQDVSVSDQPSTVADGKRADGSDESPANSYPPEELMTPADRVQKLLDTHGGQIPQSAIVDETDWSKAKVSRTLSQMEDDGDITRYRLGRGNIVTYPDTDLATSSLDDESEK